jgi:hypothetical protein
MGHPDEHEPQGDFSDGIARTYKDGLLQHPPDARPASAGATHPAPPAGLAGEGLRKFRELTQLERGISDRRRRLHERITFVKSQGASVNSETASQLVYLEQKERVLSRQRKEIHRLIDQLRRTLWEG